MNRVNIIGRVGGEIELRHTPTGKAVTEINLAVDDGWGENKKTVWVGVTIWGATAELAQRAIRKGDRVGIDGRLSQDEWEDKATGKKQRKTKVTCDNMFLLEPRRDGPTQPVPASTQSVIPPRYVEDDDSDSIPF
jgi:single-strand DNA-binding protein